MNYCGKIIIREIILDVFAAKLLATSCETPATETLEIYLQQNTEVETNAFGVKEQINADSMV